MLGLRCVGLTLGMAAALGTCACTDSNGANSPAVLDGGEPAPNSVAGGTQIAAGGGAAVDRSSDSTNAAAGEASNSGAAALAGAGTGGSAAGGQDRGMSGATGGNSATQQDGGASAGNTAVDAAVEPAPGGQDASTSEECIDCAASSECELDGVQHYANWPMPNPSSLGLPNPASYDTSQAGVVIDEVTGLMWQEPPVAEEYNWAPAVQYCEGLSYAGHTDWRLPSRIELVSLVDFTRYSPSLDVDVFPGGGDGLFWTSSQRISGSDVAYWWVRFVSGDTGASAIDRDQPQRVRCVRSQTCRPTPNPRFSIEGAAPGEMVRDNGTGLLWQRVATAERFDFAEAEAFCASLRLEGEGWRLPSAKEAQTTEDETQPIPSEPAADAIFLGVPLRNRYWAGSTSARDADYAWSFLPGGSARESGVEGNQKTQGVNVVRCVR